MYKIQPYKTQEIEWDSFNAKSKNGTFLFNRKYMEYHRDRFEDFSLLIYNNKNDLVALFPANKREDVVYSHEGLTYGGIISDVRMTTCENINLFSELKKFLKDQKISSVIYKTIPQIYSDILSQEDQYTLYANGAQLIRRDLISVIDFSAVVPIQERRLRSQKKAAKKDLIVEESTDYSTFWELLNHVLLNRHNVKPTHSIEEIKYLSSLFPKNILLFLCRDNQEILAGVVLYINKKTVHAQYISTSERGAKTGALDFLFFFLIEKFKKDHKYFSFGISNENNGLYLNEGLITQKEGFGARSIIHDTYLVNLT
ncbi:MAG: GNAT family N-acetyltransferase [Alphaproteobacteria bacterium]|nr:GNAT family N-acetyltransferase [Alphaproteobacteria bacterium]